MHTAVSAGEIFNPSRVEWEIPADFRLMARGYSRWVTAKTEPGLDADRTMGAMAFALPSPFTVIELGRSVTGRVIESAASLVTLPLRTVTLLGQAELLVSRMTVLVEQTATMMEQVRVVAVDAEDTVHEARAIAAAAGVAIDEASRVAAAAGRVVQGAAATTDAADALVAEAATITGAAAAVVGQAEVITTAAADVVVKAEQITGVAGGVVGQAGAAAAEAADLLDGYAPTLREAAPLAARFVRELSPEEVTAAIRMVDTLPRLREHLVNDVLPLLGKLDQVGPDLHKLLEVTEDLRLAIAGLPGLKMLRRRGEDRIGGDSA
jgi:hypothetical protein